MEHCMFENTYKDLMECYDKLAIYSIEKLEEESNKYEKPYIRKLIELCKDIAFELESEDDDEY